MPASWPCPRFTRALVTSLSVLVVVAADGCGREPQQAPAPPAAPAPAPARARDADEPALPKVAFLGDSISAGLNLPAEEAFPLVLAARLRAQGAPFVPINAGVSGDTTAGGLRRIAFLLKQRPAVVVVELGANDGLRGVPLASIESNLRAILEQVRSAGAVPLLLGMRLPTSYGADYAEGFAAIYPRLAAELDVRFVPFFMEGVAGVPELNQEDALHPTAAGHRRLADNAQRALRDALAAATTP